MAWGLDGEFEGYGAVTGGALDAPGGYSVYHVTSLADSGPGTLRDAVHGLNGTGRYVVFDVAGTITLLSDILLRGAFVTIDGSTAPAPGITIRKTTIHDGEFIICGTHDVVVTHLRFWGLWEAGGEHSQNACTISIDGDSNPDGIAQRIILDHLSLRGSTDGGPDIWGEVADVTISWCLIYLNWHPTLVSHYPAPFQTRQRISLHHNVYACNTERQPQLRADVRNFDYVNNVVHDWGYFGEGSGFGVRIKNSSSEPKVNGNFIANAFLPTIRASSALIYGIDPGRDAEDGGPAAPVPQGTVLTNTSMGQLYVNGNLLPPENKDHWSTSAAPLPVPPAAQVTTWPAEELGFRVLPQVGMQYRDALEIELLDTIAALLPGPPDEVLGDVNCDGQADFHDINPFVEALCQPAAYALHYPDCDPLHGDMNCDGSFDLRDINAFVNCLNQGGCDCL